MSIGALNQPIPQPEPKISLWYPSPIAPQRLTYLLAYTKKNPTLDPDQPGQTYPSHLSSKVLRGWNSPQSRQDCCQIFRAWFKANLPWNANHNILKEGFIDKLSPKDTGIEIAQGLKKLRGPGWNSSLSCQDCCQICRA
ncbi:hypothetical protein DSO57_1010954 [Entomophthora muscae]|uniref:Uncharacterized protein n=1 Tax=Entomophthora muscae TaxID=34485 RepID=A0ACC2TH00_9FUNG|nr:hypothetical protein DSO57_1010954 [Entomophthora muscae]